MVERSNPEIGVGTHLGGRYELLREVGRGGFGAVFEARDEPLDRSVAVKLIHTSWTEAGEELEREATLLAGIRSPHVVRVLDASVMEEPPYLVMELLEGDSVRERIDRGGAFETEEAYQILEEVLQGLSALHDRTLLHGDLKPENVILTRDGAKLIDLGISRPWTSPQEREQASHVLGTPAYLSPELLRGGRPDPRADLYSAGLLLYEMLVGQPAHSQRADVREITDEIREGRRAPLTLMCPWLPSAVGAFVERAIEPALEDRYQSAQEMAEALAALRRLPKVTGAPAADERLGERFLLERPLAGNARIWEARDLQRDSEVTVERLHFGAGQPAPESVRKLAGLRSPHVPRIYDLVQLEPGTFVLVSERLPGRPLTDALGHPLPLTNLAATAGQLLSGLAAAHEVGLVHGALTPSTILISHVGQDAVLKLLGFRLVPSEAERPDPDYAAPELLGDDAEPTFRSDVYAAASVLFELLTGQSYVAAGRPLEAKRADLRALGSVAATAPITRTLHRALAPDPAKRFADGRAFLDAVREAVDSGA